MHFLALIAAFAASPARAQARVDAASSARPAFAFSVSAAASAKAAAPIGPAPAAFSVSLSPAAPFAAAAAPAPSMPAVAALSAAVPAPAAPSFAARVASLGDGVSDQVRSLGDVSQAAPGDARAAGESLENMIEGASGAGGAGAPAGPKASPAELDYAVRAGDELAARADELGAARGLHARSMSGAEFLKVVEDARAAADAEAKAPSPAAAAAAAVVRAQVARVARALIPADRPLMESASRAFTVWKVFGQEMKRAADEKGTLDAVVADARLFAVQVESSLEPAPAAVPVVAPPVNAAHPEDPNGYAQISEEGSVFGWRPIESSPDHGLPPLDALIRRALAEKRVPPYAAGFELAGAPRREDARAFFYGERHTDGALISENMRRLVQDARPGKPVLVLVEGYTDAALRGYAALKYLADRGLDAEALLAKGVAGADVEVRGWDTPERYDASKRPLLRHHMELLELNHLAYGGKRGLGYYVEFARAAWRAWRGRRELWRAALVARNDDLDRAVAKAAADAAASGATLHVIAGTDHLMQTPRLTALMPGAFKPVFRASLRDALGGRDYWASTPRSTAAGD